MPEHRNKGMGKAWQWLHNRTYVYKLICFNYLIWFFLWEILSFQSSMLNMSRWKNSSSCLVLDLIFFLLYYFPFFFTPTQKIKPQDFTNSKESDAGLQVERLIT
jgi:DMSO/TMAO reductase YedYZ heme-binding membrane subunit